MSSNEGGKVDEQGAFLLNSKIMSEVEEQKQAEAKKKAECVPPRIPFDLLTPPLDGGLRLSPRVHPARCSHLAPRTLLILLPVSDDADALFQNNENLAMTVDADALGADLFLPPDFSRHHDSLHRDHSHSLVTKGWQILLDPKPGLSPR